MRYYISIFLFFICFSLIAQTEYVSDLTHIKNFPNPKKYQAKLVKNKYYFLPDTLQLPVVDDFSTNKFKSYNTAVSKDSLKTSVYISFSDSILKDSSFSLIPTFYFSHFIDTVGDTTFTKTILKDSLFLFTTDTNFNAKADTVKLYPKYTIQDTVWLNKKDTLFQTTNLNKTDSTLWEIVPADAKDSKIWLNNNVYVTNHFAVQPPSIGAVVFEGLDSLGLPYDTITKSYGLADLLTSKPINISNITDDLFLSFFYQPQGLGANPPNTKDSLILEFSTDSKKWEQQWFALGTNFQSFKRVIITLDKKFHESGFQFRFKNYATLSGNLDIWLVDYIKLDKTTVLDDVAMVEQQATFLKEYTSVPWTHYLAKPGDLKDELLFKIKNNFATTSKNVQFDATILDENGSSVFDFIDNNLFVNPNIYFDEGLKHASFTEFPSNAKDSSAFEIVSFIASGVDELKSNDTVRFTQKFYNYYAYDDGTAETGYGLLGSDDGQVAYQFLALKSDTLRAVQMYFNQSLDNNKGIEFDLMVWDDFNSPPKVQQLDTTKYYGINNFVTYKLRTPIKIGNTFYVGWKNRSKTYLNVGLDRNDTLTNKLFFNTGVWSTSNIVGAPMIRPVFGSDFILGNNELELEKKLSIYPNPTSGIINIELLAGVSITGIEIQNVLGNTVLSSQKTTQVDISNLPSGVYFVSIFTESGRIIKKIIKQ